MAPNDALRQLLASELRIALDLTLPPEARQRWAEDRASRILVRLDRQQDRRYEGTEELFREEKNRGNRALPERR